MRSTTRFVLFVIAGTILGMMLDGHGPIGRLLYAPHEGPSVPEPAGLQLPLLMGGVLAQAVGLGVALALLSDAPRFVAAMTRATGGKRGASIAGFVGLLWILGSWIPHVSLHQHIAPGDLWALGAIEWGFHVTVVASAIALVRFLYLALDARSVAQARSAKHDARADA